MISTLIDKQDTFEIVRDQIAAILLLETASQQSLAVTAGKDPTMWALRVFSERSDPWEQFLNSPSNGDAPIVNVWFDSSNFDRSASSGIAVQKTNGSFNIDCYGVGVSDDVPGGGHASADEQAAANVQRAARLVRNIMMASENQYLQLRGLVWSRWPQSATGFQPQLGSNNVQRALGMRVQMAVTFNEFSPQYVPDVLELLSTGIKRRETGELYLEADYQYPL